VFDRKLDEPVSADFDDLPIEDAVAFFRNLKNVSMTIDRRALADRPDCRVSVNADEVSLRRALDLCLEPVGLDYTPRNGALFISTKEEIQRIKAAPVVHYDPQAWEPVRDEMNRLVSFHLRGAFIEEAVEQLRRLVDVPIVVEQSARGPYKSGGVAILRVEAMQFKRALAWVCYGLELAYAVRDGRVVIFKRGGPRREAP